MSELLDLGSEFSWDDVEAPQFTTVPPGVYEAQVVDVSPWSKDGKTAVVFDYLITDDPAHDGEYVGKTVREFKNYDTSNPDPKSNGLGWIKLRLVSLGMPPDYKGVPEKDVFVGLDVVLTLKQNKEHVNVSKVELLEGSDYGDEKIDREFDKSAEAEATEDNPFSF